MPASTSACREDFAAVVERYQRSVYSVAFGLLRNREEAMDVSQEVFINAFLNEHRRNPQAKIFTWLYRITVNLCIDRLRRSSSGAATRAETEDEQPGEVGELQPAPSTANNPLKAVLRSELVDKIGEALAQLPEKHRVILVLREVEGMSYEDLAATLELSKGTVMSRLHHARKKMQARLQGYVDDSDDASE